MLLLVTPEGVRVLAQLESIEDLQHYLTKAGTGHE